MISRLSSWVLIVLWCTAATAQDVIVTRHFSGHWDQPEHESQGIILQVVSQAGGQKSAAGYWFTYGDDMESMWLLGVGPVSANRIEMNLFLASGVGFLQANGPGDANVVQVGTMEIEFTSCDEGTVTFDTDYSGIGSGSFPISRLTSIYNTDCSGGVSDDTPSNVLPADQRINLVPARQGINGSGHAAFKQLPDRTEFSVEAEDLADGSYQIFVGGIDRGQLNVSLGQGETEFRSPVESGKILLTFDPLGEVIELHDNQGAVLTSGDSNIGGDDNGGSGSGGEIDFGIGKIEVDMMNTGIHTQAYGKARYDGRDDRTEFSVEIEEVPIGTYGLKVGGATVGEIEAKQDPYGSARGELEFRVPVEPGKTLLDFDPRGQTIEVLDGAVVILSVSFPVS